MNEIEARAEARRLIDAESVVVQMPDRGGHAAGLDTAPASSYAMRGLRWFWPGRFAMGKLGLIGGLPDKGKGLISADMIARATSAGGRQSRAIEARSRHLFLRCREI
jgi:hypothetical protein